MSRLLACELLKFSLCYLFKQMIHNIQWFYIYIYIYKLHQITIQNKQFHLMKIQFAKANKYISYYMPRKIHFTYDCGLFIAQAVCIPSKTPQMFITVALYGVMRQMAMISGNLSPTDDVSTASITQTIRHSVLVSFRYSFIGRDSVEVKHDSSKHQIVWPFNRQSQAAGI